MAYENKYFQDCDKRWNKFTKIRQSIVGDDSCYCKEKYGRYDITYYGDIAGAQDRLREEVENESERCCQYCGRHSPQIWLDRSWIIHLCRWHTLCGMCVYLYNYIKNIYGR